MPLVSRINYLTVLPKLIARGEREKETESCRLQLNRNEKVSCANVSLNLPCTRICFKLVSHIGFVLEGTVNGPAY